MSAAHPIVQTLARYGGVATLALLLAAPAMGQDRQDRTPWWSQRPPARDEPVRMPSDVAEREAARLYADARVELDADRLPQAQRKLEVLVARHPMSALADVARRDLQRVYAVLNAASTSAQSQPVPAPSGSVSSGTGFQPTAILQSQTSAPSAIAPSTLAPVQATPRVNTPAPSSVRLANEDFRQQAGDRVFFTDGSTDIGPRAKVALEAQAAWLIRHPDIQLVVEGHADDLGSRDVNKQLAEKRAEVVRLRLNDLGVPNERMRVMGLGRNEPVADCPDQNCKTQNRRVVTVIVQVPTSLGFDAPAKRTLGAAAGAVGQPSRAP